MIKKIGSWVFGSFFRTMGRFFFFLFFGFLVAMIIQKNDWSSIHWTDLFGLEYIKADTYVQGVDTPWYKSDLTTALPRNGTFDYITETTSYPNSPLITSEFYVQTPFDISNIRTGYWTVPFYIDAPAISIANTNNGNLNFTHYLCARWIQSSSGTYQCNLWSDPSTSQTFSFTDNEFIMPQTDVQAIAVYQNGYTDICTVDSQNNVIKCPVASYTNLTGIARVQIKSRVYYSSSTYQTTYYVGLGRKVNKYSNDTQSIINNQNQNTQQTIDTITDTNTTEANTTANNFFANFTSQDNGGISSIITAPLQAISGLVSAQCVQIELPIPYLDNKTLILPCMSAIYQEHFGGIFTLYQTIIFGAIAYRMLISLFMMIQGFKNPDDDKIEVVDL